MSDRLSAGYKRPYELSGRQCALTGCENSITAENNSAAVTTSDAAHIFGRSRQGPRGVEVS